MFKRKFIPVILGLFILLPVAILIFKPFDWVQDWSSNKSLEAARAAMMEHQPDKAILAVRRPYS